MFLEQLLSYPRLGTESSGLVHSDQKSEVVVLKNELSVPCEVGKGCLSLNLVSKNLDTATAFSKKLTLESITVSSGYLGNGGGTWQVTVRKK